MSISRVLAVAVAVVSLAGWSAGQADASIVIDDYSISQTSPGTVELGTISSSGVPSGPVDLDRTLAIGGSGALVTDVRVISNGDVVFTLLKSAAGTMTKTMTVSYALDGPLNLFGGETNDAFYLHDFSSSGVGLGAFSLFVSVNGGASTRTVDLLTPFGGTLVIPFSTFSNPNVFGSVSSLSLELSATLVGIMPGFGVHTALASASWSSLVAAPEPSSMLMAGLGLVGLVGAARRRRSA